MKKVLANIQGFLLNDGKNSRLFRILSGLLAFFIPFLLTIILFKKNNYYPFVKDGHSLMMVDMSGQYIAFFRYYKEMLDGNVNLLYTLGKVTGGEFLSIFTYYLASPFNLLIKFFTIEELPKALMWIVVLKISTAGLTSYIAFRRMNEGNYFNLIFSISYSLIAYSFVYYSNIMWLDGVYLLPLIALGINKIVNDESPLLYVISLALVIMTSWYIGIMIAIFSVLFFFVLFNNSYKSRKNHKKHLVLFFGGSIIAGLISFAFWGTAFLTILGTKGGSSFTKLQQTLFEFNNFIAIQKGFFSNSFAGFSDISGTATTVSFYVGVLPVILTILYFFKKDVEYRQKTGVLLLFIVYLLAFNNKGLNDLFHGGPRPNWFPGRYAFIFGFLLTLYGSSNFATLKKVHWSGFVLPPVSALTLFFIIKGDEYRFNNTGYVYFMIVYVILLAYYVLTNYVFPSQTEVEEQGKRWIQHTLKPTTALLLLVVATLNVYGNNNHILATYNAPINRHNDYETYLKDENITKAVNYLKAHDQSLYRLEKSFLRKGTYNNADNDALYYGYNGISHYSSNEKQQTMLYMRKLGFHYNGFNLSYANGSTLAVNAYLGVKYLIDNGTNRNFDFNRYLDKVPYEDTQLTLYENKYALPFLFATTPQRASYVSEGYYINEDEIHWFDHFEYQNAIYKSLNATIVDEFGEAKDIFKKVDVSETLTNVEALAAPNHYKVLTNGKISYTVETPLNTNYYYYFNAQSRDHDLAPTFSLRENGRVLTYFSYHGYQINGLESNRPSSVIDVYINGTSNDFEVKPEIYYEDTDVLAQYINAVKDAALVSEMTQGTTSRYTAKVLTKTDDQSMLLTLPYDRNLKVYVDGKRVKTTTAFNIYTNFTIKKAGEHQILIKYGQPSFQIGLPFGIFALGATIFAHFKFKHLFKKEEE